MLKLFMPQVIVLANTIGVLCLVRFIVFPSSRP